MRPHSRGSAPSPRYPSASPSGLPGSPTTYNVRVFFDGVTVQGDPHPGESHIDCGTFGCADAYNSSVIVAEQILLLVDFIEAIA